MITEKTVYVTEDGIEFNNYNNARSHEEVLSRLTFDEEKWLGPRLEYPGIGGGYCLETKHHKKNELIQVAMDILILLNTHCIEHDDEYDPNRFFNKCLGLITKLQSSDDDERDYVDNVNAWNQLTNFLNRYSRWYYYKDEPTHINNDIDNGILSNLARRLHETSWHTGIEYPECGGYVRQWRLREHEWEDFVQKEKEYIANGGTYR